MKSFENLVVGCGSRGLATLWGLIQETGATSENTIALEGSSRVGGTQFLISRCAEATAYKPGLFDIVRSLPDIRIWWERNWTNPLEVDWRNKDWAYTLPQWESFFGPLVELKVKEEVFDQVKGFVLLEKPVSEISYDNAWIVRSGEKIFSTQKLYWTLGQKALQNALGKKEAEVFMEKNPDFNEAARDAEGVLVANYSGAQGESQFVGIPVRHEHKLYLCFVSVHEGQAECFTFLPSELLKTPKDLSFFEKSIRRTLKHTLGTYLADPSAPTLGVFSEARGSEIASPWRLKDDPVKGIYFSSPDCFSLRDPHAAHYSALTPADP